MITDHVFRPYHKQREICAYMNCQRKETEHGPRRTGLSAAADTPTRDRAADRTEG